MLSSVVFFLVCVYVVKTTGFSDVLHDRNVFICGFGDSSSFVTNFLQPSHVHRHHYLHNIPFSNSSSADVVVLHGLLPHCVTAISNFTGLIIYIDNEAGRPIVKSYISNFTQTNLQNLIYLGVLTIDLPTSVTKIPCIFGVHTLEYSEKVLKKAFNRRVNPPHKTRFLAYAASKCIPFREHTFDALVTFSVEFELGNVSSYGACHGSPQNVNYSRSHMMLVQKTNDGDVPSARNHNHITNTSHSRKHFHNNGALFRPYKYVLAMENDDVDFYLTEKIIYAYQAGAIPLYWGASTIVHDIFHPDTFIHIDPLNLQPALDRILQIEREPALYRRIMQTPVLLRGDETMKKYFAVGISGDSASDPKLCNASLSNRIWASIIQHLHHLPDRSHNNIVP